MLSFHQVVAEDFAAVNQRIIEKLHSDVALVEDIGQHLIEAGGKRLRPLMTLLAARCLGYSGRQHLDLAVIIEFIHTATLLHDDVVDTSHLRRGRPTANAQWGNAPSVLVGDFLYSRAFQMMVAIGNMDIMSVMSETTNLIAEGEVQQLVNAKNPEISEADYFHVIGKKTAILFASACEVAAVLSGAEPAQREAMRAYGQHLGMAFQLVDDALDYSGSTETLGKNLGDDLAEGKPTLPLIIAMDKGTPAQAEQISSALSAGDKSRMLDILQVVEATGAMDYTLDRARKEIAEAHRQLSLLPQNRYTQTMAAVAEFALNRRH